MATLVSWQIDHPGNEWSYPQLPTRQSYSVYNLGRRRIWRFSIFRPLSLPFPHFRNYRKPMSQSTNGPINGHLRKQSARRLAEYHSSTVRQSVIRGGHGSTNGSDFARRACKGPVEMGARLLAECRAIRGISDSPIWRIF